LVVLGAATDARCGSWDATAALAVAIGVGTALGGGRGLGVLGPVSTVAFGSGTAEAAGSVAVDAGCAAVLVATAAPGAPTVSDTETNTATRAAHGAA
jgi:hypothetical protein